MKLLNRTVEFSSKKKLTLNTSISLLYQIVAVVCGFVLPRLVLQAYGSQTNGLLQAITQFLSIISFMELGVGAVIQSALYKPMADNDSEGVSLVVASGDRFFKKIASALIIYSVFLTVLFPIINNSEYGWWYTAVLVLAMSISTFAQYYFGLMDSIILTANQQGYILYTSQILTIVGNTAVCALLINFGCSIQVIKMATSVIFLLKPLIMRLYIKKHYPINRKKEVHEDPIKQKWDGVFQHISYIILENTDVVVLTLFTSMTSVSIYSVYHLVIYGIKNVYVSVTHGFQSFLGELWAKKDKSKLNDFFAFLEYIMHMLVVFLYTCMGILIIPFIKVYTKGIDDAEYVNLLFAVILVCANAVHCIRYPYHLIIKAAGDYKRTQKCFIISAGINLFVSILMVKMFGLVGVAIGTLIAMLYQAVWMAVYNSKNLIMWPIKKVIKQFIFDIVVSGLIIIATKWISLSDLSYGSWFVMAVKVAVIAFVICFVLSYLFYKKQVVYLFNKLLRSKR